MRLSVLSVRLKPSQERPELRSFLASHWKGSCQMSVSQLSGASQPRRLFPSAVIDLISLGWSSSRRLLLLSRRPMRVAESNAKLASVSPA